MEEVLTGSRRQDQKGQRQARKEERAVRYGEQGLTRGRGLQSEQRVGGDGEGAANGGTQSSGVGCGRGKMQWRRKQGRGAVLEEGGQEKWWEGSREKHRARRGVQATGRENPSEQGERGPETLMKERR